MSKTYNWCDEKLETLVDMFQERTYFYNVKHKEYFNRDKRNKAHSDIAKELGTTELEIKNKLRGLRTQYSREKQKIGKPRTGTGADEIVVSKWNLYPRLQFLEEHILPKTSISNLNILQNNNLDENSDIDDDVFDESISMISNTSSIHTKRLPITKQVSKKRSIQEDEIFKKAIVCLDKVTNEEPEDGLTIFGRHIASELREIQYPHLQRWAKLQIQQIIFSAQNSNTQHSKYSSQQSQISQPHSQEDFQYNYQFSAPSNRELYPNSTQYYQYSPDGSPNNNYSNKES